jgi:hypothetical protein
MNKVRCEWSVAHSKPFQVVLHLQYWKFVDEFDSEGKKSDVTKIEVCKL